MKLASFVLSSLALSIQYYADKYKDDDFQKTLQELEGDFGLPRIKTYDYIIGGGTAGSILAGRLSESCSVLLLEAGGEPVPAINVPFFATYVSGGEHQELTNFVYETVPQVDAALGKGGIIKIPTGKMYGGSGSHNEMIHNRGSPRDYDNYARLVNDDSWKYENVLNYFKKAETYVGQLINQTQEDYYGYSGPLTVDLDEAPILPKWYAAGNELGFSVNDPNGLQVKSFAPVAKLIKDGKRVSTYTEYVKPFMETRVNLTVLPYSEVDKILLDEDSQAYGVRYKRHNIPQIAHASKEIIISAGAYVSPLLLIKSGIGPQEVLQEAGIPVKRNLPGVGQNYRDHIGISLSKIKFNASALPYFSRIPESEFESITTQYLTDGSGIFGKIQQGGQIFSVSSRAVNSGESLWPDAIVYFDTSCPTAVEDEEEVQGCFWITLERTRSVGFVTLNTTAYKEGETSIQKLAVIDPKVFSDPTDIDVLLENIRLAQQIINTRAFQEMGASYQDTPIPACSEFSPNSDEYWRCYIKQTGETAIHMVGTTTMGQGNLAVTDSKFKVWGVPKLRVVDAGVLPLPPNSNLNAPVVMLAEKAAEDILRDAV